MRDGSTVCFPPESSAKNKFKKMDHTCLFSVLLIYGVGMDKVVFFWESQTKDVLWMTKRHFFATKQHSFFENVSLNQTTPPTMNSALFMGLFGKVSSKFFPNRSLNFCLMWEFVCLKNN